MLLFLTTSYDKIKAENIQYNIKLIMLKQEMNFRDKLKRLEKQILCSLPFLLKIHTQKNLQIIESTENVIVENSSASLGT